MSGQVSPPKIFLPLQELRELLESVGEDEFKTAVLAGRAVLVFGSPQGVDSDETVATEKLFSDSSTKNAPDPSSWYQDTAAILRTRHSQPNQVLVGRSPTCDLLLVLPSVAKDHAMLEETPQGWTVTDLASKSGTFVNDERLAPNTPRPLADGETVRFGRYLPLRLCAPATLIRMLDPGA